MFSVYFLLTRLVICTLPELSDAGEQTPAWKKEFEERQRDEAFSNALMNRIRQSRGTVTSHPDKTLTIDYLQCFI